MNLEIKWIPNVCSCEILQDRYEPEAHFSFEKKCEIHKDMSDQDARASIIQMCIDAQQGQQ